MTFGATRATNTNFSGFGGGGNHNPTQSSPLFNNNNSNGNVGFTTKASPFATTPNSNFASSGNGKPSFASNTNSMFVSQQPPASSSSWGTCSGVTTTATAGPDAGTFSGWSTKQSTGSNPFVVAQSVSTNSNRAAITGSFQNAGQRPDHVTRPRSTLTWPAQNDTPPVAVDDQSNNNYNHGVPKKILNYMKKMSWQFPLDEQQLEALVHSGVDVMNVATKGLASATTLPEPLAVRLVTAFSESHEIFRFINNQCMALTGCPHAVCLYNMACILSLLIELELRFLEESNKETKEIGRDLLTIAKAYEVIPICDKMSVLPVQPGGNATNIARIGSKEATIGKMIYKQLKAWKACLGAAVSVGWSDIEHLQTDPDLKALRALLPDNTNTRNNN